MAGKFPYQQDGQKLNRTVSRSTRVPGNLTRAAKKPTRAAKT